MTTASVGPGEWVLSAQAQQGNGWRIADWGFGVLESWGRFAFVSFRLGLARSAYSCGDSMGLGMG